LQLFELFGSVSVDTADARRNLNNFDNSSQKSSNKFAKFSGLIASASVAAVAAIGAVAVAVTGMAVKFSDDLQGAMNSLQASTGKTNEEMQGLNDAMVAVYNNNFGDSLEDISSVMGNVTQVIGGTAEEIQRVTENAYLMNDVFGIDTESSINTVNSLMQNFGITSEEAFNLITIGAQEGANKNGDLIDTLNEYAPAFSNLGLSAGNFTSVLISGAESGAFSIDKIGDAVKEFEIRSQDLSENSAAAFRRLGLDAEQMFVNFAEGGEKGAASFSEVINRLIEIEDPVKQNTIGVGLFGTMFEDLGPKGIKALKDINKEVVNTEGALDSMNKIKYNTFGEAMEGLKRNMETGILLPLGNLILPILNKFADWIAEYMPVIQDNFDKAITFIVDKVLPPFTYWMQLIYNNILPELKKIVDIVINEVRKIFDENIGVIREKVLPPLIEIVQKFYKDIMPRLLRIVQEYLPLIMEIFSKYIGFIVSEVIPPIIEIIQFLYNNVLPFLLSVTEITVDGLVAYWTFFKENVLPILEWFYNISKQTFENVQTIITVAISIINKSINNFRDVLKAVMTFISTTFLSKIKSGINGVKTIFSEVFGQLEGIVKTAMNRVISIVNKGLRALNKISVTIPSAIPGIGGQTIGINAPLIPALAKGGTLKDNGLALVGENGPELISGMKGASVIPLNKSGGINININNPVVVGDNAGNILGEEIVETLSAMGVFA